MCPGHSGPGERCRARDVEVSAREFALVGLVGVPLLLVVPGQRIDRIIALVSLAIIAAFFWLQVKLTEMSQDWGHTWFIYISIFIEVGLIWMWNSMFS